MSDFQWVDGDATDSLQAALDASQGDAINIAPGHYTVGRLWPRTNTRIVMSPGVHFHKRASTGGVWYMSNVSDVHLIANGATIHGEDAAGSTSFGHNVYALGTTDCSIVGLVTDGASPGKDGLYIGLGTKPNERLQVIGGKFLRAKRNGISVVAGFDTLIQGVECAYSTGSPGAGIDVEANFYGHVDNTRIIRPHVHHNQNAGILSIFGCGTQVVDPDSHDNGTYGFAVSSGGYQFMEDRYRPNVDMVGVTGFDMATGTVFVATLPPVGTPVNFSVRNGAQRPPELSGSYYVVSRHVGANGVILGKSVRHSEVTSFSLPGAGIMSADPYESDIRLRVFGKGQSDRGSLRGGRIHHNGTQGVFIGGAGRMRLSETEVFDNGSNQVQISYTRDVEMECLRISGGAHMGIAASSSGGRLRIANCDFDNVGGRALSVTEWTDAQIEWNNVTNCAATELSSAKAGIHLASCLRPTAHRNKVTQHANNTTTLFGIYAENSVIDGTFTHNDLTGAGTTPANALRVPAGSVCEANIGRDGV